MKAAHRVKLLLFIALICFANFAFACEPSKANSEAYFLLSPDSSADSTDSYTDAVWQLPEVKMYFSIVQEAGICKPVMMVRETPSKRSKYYWIQVGAIDEDRFIPTLNFAVDPITKEVKFLDTVADKLISLKKWRETKDSKSYSTY